MGDSKDNNNVIEGPPIDLEWATDVVINEDLAVEEETIEDMIKETFPIDNLTPAK